MVITFKMGESSGRRTKKTPHTALLHSSLLSQEEERDPPTGAARHYQQIDEQLTHTGNDLDQLSAYLFLYDWLHNSLNSNR